MTPYASGEPDPTRPPAAQLSAAIALLDRSWGRPHQALEVGISRASLEDMKTAPANPCGRGKCRRSGAAAEPRIKSMKF